MVEAVGRYFGREPRYSQQEAEAQAKEAIDAAVKKGRPPAEEWAALASRTAEINRELAARPAVDPLLPPPPRPPQTGGRSAGTGGRPRPVNQILRPPPPAPAVRSARAPAKPAKKGPAKRG